jgi:heme/copper-type cytochrome/quinol oxidase subunit 2
LTDRGSQGARRRDRWIISLMGALFTVIGLVFGAVVAFVVIAGLRAEDPPVSTAQHSRRKVSRP